MISFLEPQTRKLGETKAFLESKATLPPNNSPDFIKPKTGRSQHMVTDSYKSAQLLVCKITSLAFEKGQKTSHSFVLEMVEFFLGFRFLETISLNNSTEVPPHCAFSEEVSKQNTTGQHHHYYVTRQHFGQQNQAFLPKVTAQWQIWEQI